MKSTTTISKMKTQFTLENATNYGGFKIFLAYLEKIKLAKALQCLPSAKASNSLFPVYRILLYLSSVGCSVASGFSIFASFNMIHSSGVFLADAAHIIPCCTKNWCVYVRRPRIADGSAADESGVIRPCLPSEVILDLDSTVEIVYGDQSGAAKGTNPHKPGRKSYHPLLAFEGQSRLCLNAVLQR